MFNIFKSKNESQNFVNKGKQKSGKELLAEYQSVFSGKKADADPPVAKPALKSEPTAGVKRAVNDSQADLREWKAPKILKTNLIQDESTATIDTGKNSQVLIICVLAAVLIIAIGYGGLFYWESLALTREAALNEKINSVNADIASLNKELATAEDLEKKINMAGTLLNKHVYWSNFFKLIEDNTLSNVFFSGGFTGDIKGEYRLNVMTDSFVAIGEQVKIFKQNKNIKQVAVNTAGLAEKQADPGKNNSSNQVSFDLQLVVDPKVFYNQNAVSQ